MNGASVTRVLALTRGVAGAYCAKLLRDTGADVVRVAPAGDDPLRTRTTGAGGEDSALFRHLHAGVRHAAPGADFPTRAAVADVVVEDLGPGGVDVSAMRAANPRLVVVSISPFGHTGPWAGQAATEFTLQAWCGSTASRGLPERVPVAAGGGLGEWTAGAYAAAAALAAARQARATGAGDHLDVSAHEAMLLTQNTFGNLFRQLGAPVGRGPARMVDLPSVEPTKDGYVGFCTVTAQQFQDFLVMIERPDLLADAELATAAGRRRRRKEFLTAVHAWTTRHTTVEILELADALRIPAAPVVTPDGIDAVEHFRERRVLVDNPHGFRAPGVPYRLEGSRPPAPGRADLDEGTPWAPRPSADSPAPSDAPPLAGLRVVDLTAFWAGPSATWILAALGADVIKVESTRRPDPMRFTTARRDAERWWEYGPVFHGSNTGKRAITLDLTRDEGRELLGRLVAGTDVVIENGTPRVLHQLGIPPEWMHARNPAAVVVRMPAFGLDGPWRDRPGFAQTMEQAGGLAAVTGEADLPPMLPRASDPIAGAHAVVATLAALERRDATGRGLVVEVPMIETVLNVGAEAIVEATAYGTAPQRTGNRGRHAAPQGVYACAGTEQWIALAVETDAQWHALVDTMGRPAWADAEELAHAADRHRAHDVIDDELARWFAERDRDEAVRVLLARDVPAAPVLDPAEAGDNEHLRARGFLERLDHPVAGPLDLPVPPFRSARAGDLPRLSRPAPVLGEHNAEILGGLLGLGPAELNGLRELGVIGEQPG
ncbi:CoA transferase [Yinghuangia sp. YIM S09857]|uniref:CaiB/BaiF CoA-transferase family protein n=1 Tax=Yinghuangia sp. YIM S09857 TaxID=3436929 RepID=UPI003F5354BE